ncbi:MAG: Fe-S cluster assembly protein SufD [Acidobacteriota bacterium]
MIGVKEKQDIYVSTFAQLEKELTAGDWAWTRPIRKAAIERFAELGFPTSKLEDWKFTSVAPIAKLAFRPARHEANGLTIEELASTPLADVAFGTSCHRLVFVNGHFSVELSCIDALPEGARVTSLAAAQRTDAALIETHLARYASYHDHAFVALNTAFMQDGAFVEIPKGLILDKPIYLIFVATQSEAPTVIYPRTLIVAGSGSQAQIIESYIGLSDSVYFTNAVTEIVAGENSVVEYYKLQHESKQAFHIGAVQVHQDRNGNFTSHTITLGGGLVRNELNAVLDGSGIECSLNGLYVTGGRQHVDNHTVVDHCKPHGTSRELYKGILGGKSSAVFNGSIVVRKDAQKTDARQSNKNLLLSEGATINSKPQLEINADDVKCTHGTSIGHLDEDSVFYLRSRGVGPDEARTILTYGFADDVLNRMKLDAIRVRLECALVARMPATHTHLEEP